MSLSKKYNIQCPSCGVQQDVDLHEVVNAAESPELKQALMQNQLNRIQCSDCDANFRVDMPLLYTDPGYDIQIHWVPESKGIERNQIIEDFDLSLEEINKVLPAGMVGPSVRLVLTRVELVELIFMIEAGFNPRVVEYLKYNVHTRNMEKAAPKQTQLLLNVQDSTDDELCFVMQDVAKQTLGGGLRYGREAYQSLCDLFSENADEFVDMFPGPYISALHLLLEEQGQV